MRTNHSKAFQTAKKRIEQRKDKPVSDKSVYRRMKRAERGSPTAKKILSGRQEYNMRGKYAPKKSDSGAKKSGPKVRVDPKDFEMADPKRPIAEDALDRAKRGEGVVNYRTKKAKSAKRSRRLVNRSKRT